MRRIPTKQRVLGGALLLALVVWKVDSLTRGSGPTPAQASQATPEPAKVVSTDWKDTSELVDHLTKTGYMSVAAALDELDRDLFVPTPTIEAAFAGMEPGEALAAKAAEEEAAREPDFKSAHKLTGVMIGQARLAVVDGRVVPLNSDLDGFTLIEVQRDYVIFRQRGSETVVHLELEQRPGNR